MTDPTVEAPSVASNSTQIPARFTKQRVFAVVLSVFLPGLGQVLVGDVRRGALTLAGFAAIFLLWWPARLPQYCAGAPLLVLAMMVLAVYAGGKTLSRPLPASRPPSKWWLALTVPLAIFGATADANLFLRMAGFQVFVVPSSAMQDTINLGDRIIVDTRFYREHRPRSGEVIIFRQGGIYLDKRVLAIEGDTISGTEGVIYVNGTPIDDHLYVIHRISQRNDLNNFGPVTLGKGELFVVGDNRAVSYDSRVAGYGSVTTDMVVGKPLYILRSNNSNRNCQAIQ
jgi:signal peptidase I